MKAAGRAIGASGRQARDRLMIFRLAATADVMAEHRTTGSWIAGTGPIERVDYSCSTTGQPAATRRRAAAST